MKQELPIWAARLEGVFDGTSIRFEPQAQTHILRIADKYKKHVEELVGKDPEKPGILVFRQALDHGHIHLFVSGYFAVPKGDSGFARSIFNGRKLSSCCAPPPQVNLFEIS